MRSTLALLALLALASSPVRAQDVDEDLQLWTPIVLQADLGTPRVLRAYVEVQPRLDRDAGRLAFVLYRPALAWFATDQLTLWGGYAFVERHHPTYLGEHRAWEQVQYDHTPDLGLGLRLIHRLREEQRLLEGRDPVAHRLRWMLRAQVPLALEGRLIAIVQNELFINWNAVDWGPRRGFDQNRTFVGPGFKLVPQARLEAGYLAQYVNRQGGEDALNHVILMQLFIDLP